MRTSAYNEANVRATALDPVLKRGFDLVAAIAGLVILSPLLLVIGLAVKLQDGGPIFYRAPRIGKDGRPFRLYKFRTMVVDADRRGPGITSNGDTRVTPVGRWLRRTKLDELPQLINVVRGEMSLVGPRPELPVLVERYQPWQHQRFVVPQGITGWWQVNGRSDRPMHLHTEDDLYYVQNYSLLLDLQILLKTVLVVLRGRGAY